MRVQLPDVEFTVVDILQQPAAAREFGILATPVLIRMEPSPQVRIVGDLQNLTAVQDMLGLENIPIDLDANVESRLL